ncbi:MAG: glycerophosphodiester phosphodiesterase family protein, partial [Kiritimatiellae bacterium]|nr:glycerophosphodiester phosphodiesterase family protein [Kiritimatiellia bacterium]
MERKMRVFGFLFAVGCLVRVACGGMPSMGICAHHGDNQTFPENTVPAFTNAVALGAVMIEMDIKRCQTGELIIMHDLTVDRTTDGTGNVADITFAQIRAFDTGNGIQVPTFDEAIDCLPTNIWINLHCADNVCAEVATKIQEKGRLHQAFIAASLSGIALARASVASVLTCNMSRTATGTNWTYAESDQYATDTITNNCNFIQLISDCDTAIYTKLKDAGVRINFFHFEDPADILPFYQKGGEFILTDSLATMVEAANGLAGGNALEYAYRKGNKNNLQWDETGNWVMHSGEHYQVYAVPTTNNDTYLWADVLQTNPLHLSEGVNAVTKAFVVGHSSGGGRHILFEFDGGTMTNVGNVAIGNSGNGRGTVNFHNGYWEPMGNFNVGASTALNRLTVDGPARLVQKSHEFRVGQNASGPGGIVTNNGTIVTYDIFPGESGTGVVECAGNMTIGNKLTIGRNAGAVGYFHLCEGGTLTKSNGTMIHAGFNGEGTLVLDETPNFLKWLELSAARGISSKGRIILNNQASPTKISPINLAYGKSSSAVMEMNDQSYLNNIDYICVGAGTNSTATLALNDDSLISNVRTVKVANAGGSVAELQLNGNGTLSNTIYFAVGTAKNSTGTLRMQGGTLTIKDGGGGYYPLLVGSKESIGKIHGWGNIWRTNPSNNNAIRIDLWGQVIA